MSENLSSQDRPLAKRKIAAAMLLVLGLLVFVLLSRHELETTAVLTVPDERMPLTPAAAQEADAPAHQEPAAGARSPVATATRPEPSPALRPALTQQNFREFNMLASSYEDALWLQMHGYPDSTQLRDYQTLPLGELEALAASGDLVAKAMAGTRLALAYKSPDGILMLQQAAVEGSVHALSTLAHIYADRGPQQDRVLAEAYRRLALTRGDYVQAAFPLGARLSPREAILAEANYLRLTREFAQARAERHLPPFETEIRPGFDEFLARLGEIEVVEPAEGVDPDRP